MRLESYTPSIEKEPRESRVDTRTPLPMESLPEPIRALAQSVAAATGTASEMTVIPALTAAAAAIGSSRYVFTKESHGQPLGLFAAVVAPSGCQKSEPYGHAVRPLEEIDRSLIKKWEADNDAHRQAMQRYAIELSEWKKEKDGPLPNEPKPPARGRITLNDFSFEALLEAHAGHPRGVTIAAEELSSFFGGFERYSGKGAVSSEQSRYLTAYDGRSLTAERVSKFRDIPRASVCIVGTVQPGILRACLTAESRANGLAARFWFTAPETTPPRWNSESVSRQAIETYGKMLRGLYDLEHMADAGAWPSPIPIIFDRAAQGIFGQFMNDLGEQSDTSEDDVRAALSKWIGRCARLAGILHCCDIVTGTTADSNDIKAETVERAVRLSQWGIRETERVYAELTEDAPQRTLRIIADWIRRKGGKITARNLSRGRRDVSNSDHGDQILSQMVAHKFGTWEGIQGSRQFVLDPSRVDDCTVSP